MLSKLRNHLIKFSNLLAFLKQALRREVTFAYTGPDGLQLLLKGQLEPLQDLLKLWYKDQDLSLKNLKQFKQQTAAHGQPDVILSSAPRLLKKTQVKTLQSPIVMDQCGPEATLFTQAYVEMDVPLRPSYEEFLFQVLPKKRRYYIKKSQKFPYHTELNRDPDLLAFFLREILNPSTSEKHGEHSHQLDLEQVLEKGDSWELLLLRSAEGEILGGNLLLRSKWRKQLRIWRQAVLPRLDETPEKHDILLVLNTAPLELGCREGLDTVSFGISPHLMDDSNFYSKRLWACRPSWNQSQVLVEIKVLTQAGRDFIEKRPLLCESPDAGVPDTVLVPRAWTEPAAYEHLSEWLNKYGFQNLLHLAVLHEQRIEYRQISSLQPGTSPLPAAGETDREPIQA